MKLGQHSHAYDGGAADRSNVALGHVESRSPGMQPARSTLRTSLEAFVDFDRRSVKFSDATETQPVQIPFPAHSVEWYKALALSCGPYSNDQWSTDISLGISLLERDDLRQDALVAAHVAAVATHFRWHPCPKKHLRWDKDRSRP